MRSTFIFLFIFMANSSIAICQEVFIDITNKKINLFLGALNERSDSLKILEDSIVKWKCVKDLEQQDLLSGKKFIAEILKQKLHFVLEGYEPFWSVKITKNELVFTDFKTGETRKSGITIYSATKDMNPRLYFMFKTSDNDVFGVVNYAGWNPRDQQQCECNISEEVSLYEAYIWIDKEIYRGCAKIESGF